MNKNKPIIPIFFSIDENYLPFLAVSLKSIIDNASKNYKYEIKVLNSGIKESEKAKLNKFNNDNFDIEFVDITNYISKISKNLHTRDYYSKTTYYRLFIPNLYPNYDKALYLDSDIIVRGDISELYNYNLGDNLLGAITDEFVYNSPELNAYLLNRLGLPHPKYYFNAGILVMNLKGLREFDFEDKFIKLIKSVTFTVAQDQDYLNVICKGRVHYIDIVWDKMPFQNDKINEDDLKLIHYNLSLKPWHEYNVPYEKYFWHYSKQTDFHNEIIEMLKNYTDEQRAWQNQVTTKLLITAEKEANDLEVNKNIQKIINSVLA